MRLIPIAVVSMLALSLTGCSSDSGGDGSAGPTPPSYEDVTGSYIGTVAGATPPATITGTLTLSLTNSGSELGGTYAYSGTVTGGPTPGPFLAVGTVSGTLQSGPNPSMSALFTVPCTNGSYSSGFGAIVASANRQITLTFGSIVKMSADCQTNLLLLDNLTGTLSPQ